MENRRFFLATMLVITLVFGLLQVMTAYAGG